jgi:hypothetical protein
MAQNPLLGKITHRECCCVTHNDDGRMRKLLYPVPLHSVLSDSSLSSSLMCIYHMYIYIYISLEHFYRKENFLDFEKKHSL